MSSPLVAFVKILHLAPSCAFARRAVAVLATALLAAACATRAPLRADAAKSAPTEPSAAVAGTTASPALPKVELTQDILYEFLLAEIAGQRGNVELAAQAYLDLAKRTRDPRIARRATEVALYARMNNAALEAARLWHEADPASPRALRALAGLLVANGRYEEALPLIRRLLAQSPGGAAEAFAQLNRTLAGAQDKRAALKLMQSLAADYPELPEAHFAVAQAAAGAGDRKLAIAELRQARTLRPDWEQAALAEAQLLLRDSPEEALAELGGFLRSHPQAREAQLGYARMLVARKRYADARAEFEKLLAAYPNNTDVLFAVALLSLQLQDYTAAENELKRLLDSNYSDKDSVRLYLGQTAEEKKDYPQALFWYGQVGRGDQYVAAQVRYARVLARQGKLDAARGHLEQLQASDPQQRMPFLLAEAQLLREANRVQEAFDLLGRELKRSPDDADLLYDYAMLAEKLDRMDIVEASLRKLIALHPDHAQAYNALGYSLADRNQRLPEARELIEKALKLAPDDAFIIDSMGWVLYRMGDLKDSLGYLQRAFADRPDPEIAAHLGEVLWALGQRDEAEKLLREAVRKNPDNEVLVNTLKRLTH